MLRSCLGAPSFCLLILVWVTPSWTWQRPGSREAALCQDLIQNNVTPVKSSKKEAWQKNKPPSLSILSKVHFLLIFIQLDLALYIYPFFVSVRYYTCIYHLTDAEVCHRCNCWQIDIHSLDTWAKAKAKSQIGFESVCCPCPCLASEFSSQL